MPLLAKDAIEKYNVELMEKLPLENPIFFGMMKKAKLFHLGTDASVSEEPTRAKKVTFYLQHVFSLQPDEDLPKLCEVMKKSKMSGLVKLADEIKAETEPVTNDNRHQKPSDTNCLHASSPTKPAASSKQCTVKTADFLSVQFSTFVATIEELLEACHDKLEQSKRFCSNLTISGNSDELLFSDEQMQKVNACTTFSELFTILRKHWSWKDYSILKHIIGIVGLKEAEDEEKLFETRMASYQGMKIISENISPETIPPDYIRLSVLINKPYRNLTLEKFTELRDFVFSNLDIKYYTALPFIKFNFSSLYLEWYVLKKAAPHMIKMAEQNLEIFKSNCVVFIQIDQFVVLDWKAKEVDDKMQLMAHMKIYMKYDNKLVKALPMDDVTFTTQLASNGIYPDSVAAHIESLGTQPDKADYYLKKVIKTSLDIDETAEFNELITVMEKCGYSHVERMANKMKSDLDKELKENPAATTSIKRSRSTFASSESAQPKKQKKDDAEFDCSIAIENITNNYGRLVNVPVKSMLVKLISKGVIPIGQKQWINFLTLDSDKMDYILDKEIIPELECGKAKKFKGFLEAMEESDDIVIVELANILGGSERIPDSIQEKSSERTKYQKMDEAILVNPPENSTNKGKMQSDAIPPTINKVALIQVGHSEKVKCNGKHGGSYLWKGHDFILTLPPDCADGTVTITLKSYLPSSTQEHCLVSAVFDVTTNIEKFKKPVTIRFPHCANIISEKDKEKLCFLILHEKGLTYEFKKGYFEAEKPFGSIEVTEFCKLSIFLRYFMLPILFRLGPLTWLIPGLSHSQNVIETPSNLGEGCISEASTEKISIKYLDLLILPKLHNEIRDWHGTYCIIRDSIPTYWQHLKEKRLIHSARQVLERNVIFVENTDEAEIYLVDEDRDGDIISLDKNRGNNKILRKEVDFLVEDDTQTFPRCFLHIYGKISSSCRLKIKGLCASGQKSSEFNLATPTVSDYKFRVHNVDQRDSGVHEITPSKPEELTVHKDRITETTITISWKEPSPADVSILRYEVEYKRSGEDSVKVKNIPSDQILTCEVTGLIPYTEYEFRVAGINSAGHGPFTDVVTQFTRFDYPSAVEQLKKQLDKKLKVLNYDNMETGLYANDVITDDQRMQIKSKIGHKKMDYLIVDILIPSLKGEHSKKYKSFLKVMEHNDDTDLQSAAKMLGK